MNKQRRNPSRSDDLLMAVRHAELMAREVRETRGEDPESARELATATDDVVAILTETIEDVVRGSLRQKGKLRDLATDPKERRNPSRKEPNLDKALVEYRKFHGRAPPKITKTGPNPRKVLIVLGRLIEVVYEPTTGHRRRVHWFHKFGKNAKLATDPSGKELHIITAKGARQVDFHRGIVS